MEDKKMSPVWYIAATHWLTAGFAVPFILSLVVGIPVILIFGQNAMLVNILTSVISLVGAWFGVMYSARYLAKTYIVNDPNQVALLSTVYLVLIGGGFRIYKIIQTGVLNYEQLVFLAVVVIFYLASQRFIKNS